MAEFDPGKSTEGVPHEIDLRLMISRDLEQTESGDLTRGPIKRVVIRELEDGSTGESYKWAEIYLDWMAVKTVSGWQKYAEPEDPEIGVQTCGINLEHSTFRQRPDGTVGAWIPYVGRLKILKEGDNLSKESVSGFNQESA